MLHFSCENIFIYQREESGVLTINYFNGLLCRIFSTAQQAKQDSLHLSDTSLLTEKYGSHSLSIEGTQLICFIRNAPLLCRHWCCSVDCQLYFVAINLQQIPQVPLTPMGSGNNTAWDPAKPAHNNAVQRLNRCKLFLPLLNFEQLCSQHFINKDSAFRLTFKEPFKHLIRLLKIQLCP